MNESVITNSTPLDSTAAKSQSLVHQFYAKTAQILVQSRLIGCAVGASKKNKWFNLELEDFDGLKEELKFWKGQLAAGSCPPLMIDILLDVSNMKPSQNIVLTSAGGRRHRFPSEVLHGIDPVQGKPVKKDKILLESWQLTLSPDVLGGPVELPIVYKKCIVFFRSLYSYVRLMPAHKLCQRLFKQKQQGAKIVYRLSSSRIISPLDAGLDQLHSSTDMRMSLSEVDFESLETPLGIFTLHATYRLECDFALEDTNTALEAQFNDLEPQFFTPSLKRESLVPPQQAFIKPGHQAAGSLSQGALLLPASQQGVVIPQHNWNETPFRRDSSAAVSPSPDTYFRADTASNVARSVNSAHFIPFTPPTFNPLEVPMGIPGLATDDAPPFSTMPLGDASKFVMEKSDILGASPPFALHAIESDPLAQSLTIVRKPSYIFPSSSPNTIPPSSYSTHSPLLFTPTSSFAYPFLGKGTASGSINSPPAMNFRHDSLNEVEQFLSNIEQSQSLRITSGEIGKQSILKGSKVGTSSGPASALNRLRELRKENAAFTKQVDFQLGASTLQKSQLERDPPTVSDLEVPFNVSGMSKSHARSTAKIDVPKSNHPFDAHTRPSTRGRQRSATEYPMSRDNSLVFDGMRRSVSIDRRFEEDELLFNMSELDL
ncbi:autophagy protein 13 [Kappamyces sp. JEL0829]|nr:autophagy protein 13 [Kappamyces sp. JEL0829]